MRRFTTITVIVLMAVIVGAVLPARRPGPLTGAALAAARSPRPPRPRRPPAAFVRVGTP